MKTKKVCSKHQVVHKEWTEYDSCSKATKHTLGPSVDNVGFDDNDHIEFGLSNGSTARISLSLCLVAPKLLEAAKGYVSERENIVPDLALKSRYFQALKMAITKAEGK